MAEKQKVYAVPDWAGVVTVIALGIFIVFAIFLIVKIGDLTSEIETMSGYTQAVHFDSHKVMMELGDINGDIYDLKKANSNAMDMLEKIRTDQLSEKIGVKATNVFPDGIDFLTVNGPLSLKYYHAVSNDGLVEETAVLIGVTSHEPSWLDIQTQPDSPIGQKSYQLDTNVDTTIYYPINEGQMVTISDWRDPSIVGDPSNLLYQIRFIYQDGMFLPCWSEGAGFQCFEPSLGNDLWNIVPGESCPEGICTPIFNFGETVSNCPKPCNRCGSSMEIILPPNKDHCGCSIILGGWLVCDSTEPCPKLCDAYNNWCNQ